jgi:hypothetical protein
MLPKQGDNTILYNTLAYLVYPIPSDKGGHPYRSAGIYSGAMVNCHFLRRICKPNAKTPALKTALGTGVSKQSRTHRSITLFANTKTFYGALSILRNKSAKMALRFKFTPTRIK